MMSSFPYVGASLRCAYCGILIPHCHYDSRITGKSQIWYYFCRILLLVSGTFLLENRGDGVKMGTAGAAFMKRRTVLQYTLGTDPRNHREVPCIVPKVFMMCGRICSGKSTHAGELRLRHKAVVLSVDEITLALFGQDAGEKLDDYVERAEAYLYRKSLDILEIGVNVVLDWGFWTRRERMEARQFYAARGIACEFHYLDTDGEEWLRRLKKRNEAIRDKHLSAYYVDEGLAVKCESFFEKPSREEIDVWIPAGAGRTGD